MPRNTMNAEQFTEQMFAIERQARQRPPYGVGHGFPRFLQMLYQYGGVETAVRLVREPQIQDGFNDLVYLSNPRHPELTAEWWIIEAAHLFDPTDVALAKARFDAAGVDVGTANQEKNGEAEASPS